MKFLIILLIIINYILAQNLETSQNQEAINLIYQAFNVTTSSPCTSGYIGCKAFNSSDSNSLYYVDNIIFYQAQTPIRNIESDLTAFVNITKVHITGSFRITSNFLNNLDKFNYLYSIFIDTHESPISDSIRLPKSLNSIKFNNFGAKLVNGFFEGNIQFLTVIEPLKGYSIASSLNNDNNYLVDLEIPLTFNSSFPNNLNRLQSLQSLYLYVYNEADTDVNPSGLSGFKVFPNFDEFKSLTELSFDFTYENKNNIQYVVFPSSVNSIKSLTDLSIFGEGFVLDRSIGFIDVSNNQKGFYIDIEQSGDLLNSCKNRPCLVVPENSQLFTFDLDYNVSLVDFSNYTTISIEYNLLSQELPVDTIDFSSIENLSILSNGFTGKIPDEYCQISINSMIIKFNKLTDVPSCFVCIGGNGADNIIPNKFTNFDSSTNSSCSNFYINENYNKLADAQGDIIYIEGKDLGYSVDIDPSLDYKFELYNTKLGIVIPEGSGVGPFTYSITFKNKPSQVLSFSYGYKKPTPLSYYISNNQLIINGTSFSSDDTKNSVLINTQTFSTTTFTKPSLINLQSNPISALTDSFEVTVTVDGQTSNKTTFKILSKPISINTPTDKLELTGGSIQLTGNFGVSDINLVTVYINNIQCTVQSVSTTTLTINYPSVKIGGSYLFEMTIGGNYYSTEIQYKNVQYPLPNSDSSDNDNISFSFRLNNNIYLLFSLFAFIVIFI